MYKKYFIKTMGCQMNVHDSEKISGIFSESGHQEVAGAESADIVVLNTCSIREKAAHKFYSELGRLKKVKKQNPDLKIAVAGCIAQQKGDTLFKRFPYVDFIFGPNNIDNLQPWLNNGKSVKSALAENADYHTKILPIKRAGQVRAWVSIMYGCNNFCSYCIVPFTRGREKSRPSNDIYNEIQSIADKGYPEITLLGQNVNSYGKGLSDDIDFPDLLEKIHDIEGIRRIRFITSHPKDFSDKLIGAISTLSKVCEHLHLPVQAGSDRILDLMNRRYTYRDYKEKIDRLRNAIPGVAITSDIIVGFPGETEDDFLQTLNALSEIEYDGLYAFKYSKRPDTKALSLPDHLDEATKTDRLNRVIKLQEEITCRKNSDMEGRVLEVLVEGASENDPEKLTGRTRTNKIVNFTGEEVDAGKLVKVKITEAKMHSLNGEKV